MKTKLKQSFGYYSCRACNTKIREDKWRKHRKTKQHISYRKKSHFAEEIFEFLCKEPLVYTFMPKIKRRRSKKE